MSDLYIDLAWLPRAPHDFRQRCRTVLHSPQPGLAVAQLARCALDENQLRQLADAIERARAQRSALAPLVPFKLGLLGNGTLEPVVPALVSTAARHGLALECVRADFAQTVQEALAPDSPINRARPDAVLLALDYRGLPLRTELRGGEAAAASVADSIAIIRALRSGFRTHGNALSIVATLAPPPEALFGSLDRALSGTMRSLVSAYNAALVDSLRGTHDVLLDVGALAETVGLSTWYSPTQWNVAKLAFDAKLLPLYADHVCRLLGALRGKSRKCLILDLDNTVWGGVIGDDGLEGIVIGQGDATGEAYLDVQNAALALRDRGVVLAVSSKNDDGIARAAFQHHPEMLLRENHIAVFQANWDDKATNIAAIADALSLGLDSMVFLDDNPVERGFIRDALPAVAVPELPEDPALYARTLAAAGYFETIAFSEEDRRRADFYAGNARRAALADRVGDIDGYLASLEMTITFSPFDATGRSRITQLINKSNQFNLTTRRYSELDVGAFENDPTRFTLQVRLADTFGDNGMISVIICRQRAEREWEIDTWLMSCRVLGRRVEQMVLREILAQARARGIERIVGVYLPTERNGIVRDHYARLGFQLVDQAESGVTTWEMPTDYAVEAAPMAVRRIGVALAEHR